MEKILKGESFAAPLKERIRVQVERLRKKERITPRVCVVRFQNNPAFDVYLSAQKRCAGSLGIEHAEINVSALSAGQQLKKIRALNKEKKTHGIVLQMPVPDKRMFAGLATELSPRKDVEGITPQNQGALLSGFSGFVSPTALAAFRMARAAAGALVGKDVVIVGHSALVGKPLAMLFLNELATVTVCHLGTFQRQRLAEHVQAAEIVCSAAGKPQLIKGSWIKKGAIVIDVGITMTPAGIEGDVEFAAAQERAAAITPVPGGVGPLTTAILFENIVKAVQEQRGIKHDL